MESGLENKGVAQILIVDDNPVMREAIALIVDHEEDLSICGEAGNISEALSQCDSLSPDLALIDVSMKGEDGLDLVVRLKETAPDVNTVVFSLHDEAEYIDRARDLGAGGYAIKSGGPEMMLKCIRTVLEGQRYFAPADPL